MQNSVKSYLINIFQFVVLYIFTKCLIILVLEVGASFEVLVLSMIYYGFVTYTLKVKFVKEYFSIEKYAWYVEMAMVELFGILFLFQFFGLGIGVVSTVVSNMLFYFLCLTYGLIAQGTVVK